MTRFLDLLLTSAARSTLGMTTGEPGTPTRRTWPEIHAVARRGTRWPCWPASPR